MDLISLISYVSIVYGLSRIITTEKIAEPFRYWVNSKSKFFGNVVSCQNCCSIWIGILFCFMGPLPFFINPLLGYTIVDLIGRFSNY